MAGLGTSLVAVSGFRGGGGAGGCDAAVAVGADGGGRGDGEAATAAAWIFDCSARRRCATRASRPSSSTAKGMLFSPKSHATLRPANMWG
jgi:hypothetical protein